MKFYTNPTEREYLRHFENKELKTKCLELAIEYIKMQAQLGLTPNEVYDVTAGLYQFIVRNNLLFYNKED